MGTAGRSAIPRSITCIIRSISSSKIADGGTMAAALPNGQIHTPSIKV